MNNIFTKDVDVLASREYITQLTGIFNTSEQEKSVSKTNNVSSVKSLFWSINSIGYVTLSWELMDGGEKMFAVLSGNGRWELSRLSYKKPDNSTGIVKLSTVAFDSLDTYSIVFGGDI